jgi:hypothetical protein
MNHKNAVEIVEWEATVNRCDRGGRYLDRMQESRILTSSRNRAWARKRYAQRFNRRYRVLMTGS